jgi:DNA repair protein RadC
MEETTNKTTIKEWAEDDRPREKLILKGKSALSDAELIAILIGSGNRKESAVELSKRILNTSKDNLIELSKLNLNELKKFKGIGDAKAISIIAALELGRRRRGTEAMAKKKISSSRDAFELMQSNISDILHEEFWLILMDRSNQIIRKVSVSEGGFSGTIADPKKIFKLALDNFASSIILCHNHPSGNIQPSEADIKLTKKLKEAGSVLDLPVLDHIICGEEKYFSFADEGIL